MKHILIVDNEQHFLNQLRKLTLENQSDRLVEVAQSVKDAEEQINKHSFALVVADLKLDRSDDAGLQVLSLAKRKNRNTQVIMVTHYSTVDLAAQAMDAGAFDFLDKDPTGISFQAMLRSKIALALQFNELLSDEHRMANDAQ